MQFYILPDYSIFLISIVCLLTYKEFPSYTKMRAEREEFRKMLVSAIVSKETDTDDTFPNAKERELLRYYYYIKHGIDTSHIAPMTKRILNK